MRQVFMYIPRHIQKTLLNAIEQFPVIIVTGPRQIGKSTLLQHAAKDYDYITLDNPSLLALAKHDPQLLFLNHPNPTILDEVQYAPELFPIIKMIVDKKKKNGLFLLSGSQAFELMRNVHESLAGRIAVLKLSGLSLRERLFIPFHDAFIPTLEFIEARSKHLPIITSYKVSTQSPPGLFLMEPPPPSLWSLIHKGHMPRLYEQETDWELYYSSYVTTYIERDIRRLSNIADLDAFTKFMVSIAARSGELLNYSSIAQDVGASVDTIKRWTKTLEASGIIYLLRPYAHSHLNRAIKTPKVYMMDTGLMAWLTKWLTPETIQMGAKSGQFFETFVISETVKSFYNQGKEPPIYYYRDTNQKEIDLLIEHQQTIYPIEIKTSANPSKHMGRVFNVLRKQLPAEEIHVAHGTIINQYPQKLWLAEDLLSLPITYL